MLIGIALFGLLIPNGLFIYWLFYEFGSVQEVLSNHLALGFMIDAFLAVGLLAYLFAHRPPGPVKWTWFVVLSIVGGLGFSIPMYLWINFKKSGRSARFAEWWSRV